MSAAETEGPLLDGKRGLMGGNKVNETKKKGSAARYLKKELQLHLMVLPAVIFVLIFSYFPLYGLKIAFQRFLPAKGLFGNQRFVGWDNFKYVLALPNFLSVLRNTFIIAGAKIDKAAIRTPALFPLIQRLGNIPERDMFNTFNMGVGMSLVVSAASADRALQALQRAGVDAYVIGEIVVGEDAIYLL